MKVLGQHLEALFLSLLCFLLALASLLCKNAMINL